MGSTLEGEKDRAGTSTASSTLRAVEDGTSPGAADEALHNEAQGQPQAPEQAPEPPRGRSLTLLLACAVAAVSLLLAYQYQRSAQLERRVETLVGELASEREIVQVHRQRMEVVRSHLDDLSARVGALRRLASEDLPGAQSR